MVRPDGRAGQRANAGEQLGEGEGLAQVIVGAGVETFDTMLERR